jgi:hypothetical protein
MIWIEEVAAADNISVLNAVLGDEGPENILICALFISPDGMNE